MGDDTWALLAGQFADGAYTTAKGRVRTYVMHRQLQEHLAPAPASVLDVGGGAGHQSFPLAAAGYALTLLDSSPGMLAKARERLSLFPPSVAERVTFVEADGTAAAAAVGGRRFDAVLCHGVLPYLADPVPVLDQLCACVEPGGLVSILAANALASAVRPALERRWADARAALDSASEIGVLGLPTYAQSVPELSALLRARGVEPLTWYGVWHFVDWLELSGVPVAVDDEAALSELAELERESGRRDPYRQLSRVFHLVGRKAPDAPGAGCGPASLASPP